MQISRLWLLDEPRVTVEAGESESTFRLSFPDYSLSQLERLEPR
jgi:hypothetical protein